MLSSYFKLPNLEFLYISTFSQNLKTLYLESIQYNGKECDHHYIN